MDKFFIDLYNYVSERTPSLSGDPEYGQALQAYMEIEAEVKKKIGEDLLYRYQCAEAELSHRQDVAVFIQTLRLARLLLREVS